MNCDANEMSNGDGDASLLCALAATTAGGGGDSGSGSGVNDVFGLPFHAVGGSVFGTMNGMSNGDGGSAVLGGHAVGNDGGGGDVAAGDLVNDGFGLPFHDVCGAGAATLAPPVPRAFANPVVSPGGVAGGLPVGCGFNPALTAGGSVFGAMNGMPNGDGGSDVMGGHAAGNGGGCGDVPAGG